MTIKRGTRSFIQENEMIGMRFLWVVVLFLTLSVNAQNFAKNWTGHYSYNQISAVARGNGKVYAAAQNAVFTYERATGETTTISSIQGLSGENISSLYYVESDNLLFVGYENGLIDVYNPSDQSVFTFVDIVDKQTVTPPQKQINDFYENNNRLLVSTNYGVSEINLDNVEFGDTFIIGTGGQKLRVNQTAVYNGKIYAATESQGLRYAPVDSENLVDFSTWQSAGNSSYKGVVTYVNSLYALSTQGELQKMQSGNLTALQQFQEEVRAIQSTEDFMTVTAANSASVFNPSGDVIGTISNTVENPQFTCALVIDDQVFIGDRHQGLLNTNLFGTAPVQYLSPDGPLRNDVFALDNIGDNLWCVYGERDLFFNPFPLNKKGVSHLQGDKWISIPYDEIEARSIVDVSINPMQPNQVYLSSFIDGLGIVQDNEVVKVLNKTNSNIPSTEVAADPSDIRIGASAFDQQGQLWLTQAFSDDGLLRYTPGSTNFEKTDVSDVIPQAGQNNNGFASIDISDSGNLFTGTYNDGIVAYSQNQNNFGKVRGGENAGNLADNYVRSVKLDNNNQLWIGTIQGLRVLFGPTEIFDNPNLSVDKIIIEDDDGVAQELLSNISIADIEVDGNNNKWIGTNAGVFYLSENGQETIKRFTTENSPLPTDVITDIGIDDENGTVYIGTTKGLLAYRGSVTGAQDDLENVRAFPNPVRPDYTGPVTIDGLMEDANVKITDVTGNLVYEEFSRGGSIQWDTRAFGKHKVASGVYFVMVTSEDAAETKVAKIMIIR